MNQRAGKTYKSAASSSMTDAHARNIYGFFKAARRLLEEDNRDDAAFYFERIETLLSEGKALPTNDKDISRALGL